MTNDEEMRERGIKSDTEPHRDPAILRYLLHERLLSYREAAEEIEATFGYRCSKSMISRAKNYHDIRDPITDGPFADLLEGGNETEPAQPPSFFLRRSEDSPTHPFDTEVHASNDSEEGGGWTGWNVETPPTAQSCPSCESGSSLSGAEGPVSDFERGTGVFKGPVDCPPSEYRVGREDREASLVAPPWAVYSEDYPDVYKACGCGRCEERHFLDGEGGPIDCDSPVPVTIAGARRIYQKTEGKRWADGVDGGVVRRALQKYARLMKADSGVLRSDRGDPEVYCRGKTVYDDISTVLVSLRVSPTDDENRLVTPYVLVQDAKDSWGEARDKLPREGVLAYYWTFAGTDEWGTPHVHCYLWMFDPEDGVAPDDFRSVVELFCEASAYAPRTAHFVGEERDAPLKAGTVRVEHEPLLVDAERLGSRTKTGVASAFSDILDEGSSAPRRLTEGDDAQSRGAIYLGSQLPHLALVGGESDADAEAGAFFQVAGDGRNLSFGGGDFYLYAKALEVVSGFETAECEK